MEPNSIYLDGRYLAQNPDWHESDSGWKAKQVAQMLNEHRLQIRSVCEVGCGAGEVLRRLYEELGEAPNMVGYEVSPQAYELCKTKEANNLSFVLGDALEQKERFFDLVMAIDVFEHVEDCFGFLRKLRSQGTYKVFHIPLDLSVQSILRPKALMRLRRTVGHIHYFTKDLALALLKDTGYDILDARYTKGSLEVPARGWKANMMKLPRALLFRASPDLAPRLLGGFSLLVLAK